MHGAGGTTSRSSTLGIVFVLVGFAFKVSAVPFHTWAPDTYEGAPTPITAFLSVASKAAGFVAIMQLVFIGFFGRHDVWQPMFWVLAALTMTVGNLIALRQTNIVRLFAYSSVAQAGYMLAPLAVAGDDTAPTRGAVDRGDVVYLLIYAAMNLGAFAVIIAVARKTRSGEIASLRRPVRVRAGPHRADDGRSCSRSPASRRSAAGSPSSRCSARLSTPGTGAATRSRCRRRELGDRALLLRAASRRRCGWSRCPTATARRSACRRR